MRAQFIEHYVTVNKLSSLFHDRVGHPEAKHVCKSPKEARALADKLNAQLINDPYRFASVGCYKEYAPRK